MILLGLTVSGLGCSAESDDAPPGVTVGDGGTLNGSGGSTGGGATTTGGTGGDETCPPWPQSQLFPYIGPWFYGPHPGPCSMIVGDPTNPSMIREFSYDSATGRVLSASDDATYVWQDDLLAAEITPGATYTYSYEPDMVRIDRDGAPMYVFHLDANGYPGDVEMDADGQPGFDVLMRYNYENCRAVSRTVIEITPQAAALSSGFEKTMSYDVAGNLVGRNDLANSGNNETFNYDCWE